MKSSNLQYPYWLTRVFLCLSCALLILYPGTAGYQAIQQAKIEIFYWVFGGYLALMLLFTLEFWLVRKIRLISPVELWRRASFTQRFIVLFWLCTVISTLASPYRMQALLGMSRGEGLLTITLYCGCFLCVSAFAKVEPWLLWVFGIVMTVYGLICLMQLCGLNPLNLYPAGYNYFDANTAYSGIYLGTLGNAGLTAALLCLAIPLFAVSLLRLWSRKRWLLVAPLLLCVVVLFAAKIQAGVLGVLGGVILSLPIVFPGSAKRRKFLFIMALLLLLVGFLWVWNSNRTWGFVYELREILHGNWHPSFGTGRIYIWQEVLSRVPENLWFGTGPDTMAAAQIPAYSQYAPLDGSVSYIVDVAHNEFLNVLYHQGIFALLFYLAALVCSAVRWGCRSVKNPLIAIFGCAILCYCIQAFFSFSMCATAGIFWIIWALLERTSNHTEVPL